MTAQEKREHNRIPFETTAFIEKEHFGGIDNARIVNISPNGMSIQTVLNIKKGEYLSIQLQNPVTQEQIRLMADVLWAEKLKQDISQIGLRFHRMNQEVKYKVTQLMTNLDFGYEPSHAQGRVSLEENIHSEIEKILHPSDQEPTDETKTNTDKDTSPEMEMVEKITEPKKEVTQVKLNPIEFKAPPAMPKRKSRSSTLMILGLMGLIGGGIYLSQKSGKKTKQITQVNPTNTPAKNPPSTPQVAKQTPQAIQSETIAPSPAPSLDFNGGLDLNQQTWLKTVLWNGSSDNLTIEWSFSENINIEDIVVEKLNFDSANKRYLVKIPAPGEVLQRNEILFNHPMVRRARMGMHQDQGSALHIVFDVNSLDTELEISQLGGNILQTFFNK